jgi:hypothetical protein
MCPSYEVLRWDESNFDISSHPFSKSAYEAKAWAFVSDFARLKIIFENGGIYLDTDVELVKSLDLILDNKCFVGQQQGVGLCNTGLGFGAVCGSKVIEQMLTKYDNLHFDWSIAKSIACPILNSEALAELGWRSSDNVEVLNDVTVYPPRFFDPVAPGQSDILCNDTISVHHYVNSWGGPTERLKSFAFDAFGRSRVIKIRDALRGK